MAVHIIEGDALQVLRTLQARSVHAVITSPPYYGLRDYGTGTWAGGDPACSHIASELRRGVNLAKSRVTTRGGGKKAARVGHLQHAERCPCGAVRTDSQIGREETPEQYTRALVKVFRAVRRVLRDDGVCWINVGDSYANDSKWGGRTSGRHARGTHGQTGIGRAKRTTGLKEKDLIGIPWRLAFALQRDGWYLRDCIIWHKPNPMPESVEDRCTKAHEYLFMLTKQPAYFFDHIAIQQPLADNPESVARRARADNGTVGTAGLQGRPHGQSGNGTGRGQEMRNRRSVWEVASKPFTGEFCTHCQTYYEGADLARLKTVEVKDIRHRICRCGRADGWLAHFAVFPPDLIEPCIKAATSERGCCSSCGAQWERQIERTTRHASNSARAGRTPEEINAGGKWAGTEGNRALRSGPVTTTRTIGWKPTCDCAGDDLSVVPCTVLDPFGGAATTALLADRLQRDAVIIELNPNYAEMARQRVWGDATLLAEVR